MSNPVIYTPEEQTELASLQQTSRVLKNILVLLSAGHFEGKDASAIVEGGTFIQSLFNQTSQAQAALEQNARLRANTPKPAPELVPAPSASDSQ